MSNNYDNWEKLVTAVIRREELRHLALLDDLTSDCSSSTTSFDESSGRLSLKSTTSSSLAQSRAKVPVDYSDLMANHTDWKKLMPQGEDEVVWKSASLSFSLDKKTGKNCFMVGSRELRFSDLDHCDIVIRMIQHSKSRFSEVGLIDNSFIIRGSIEIQRLSPKTSYGAYMVFSYKAIKTSNLLSDDSDEDDPGSSDNDALLSKSSHNLVGSSTARIKLLKESSDDADVFLSDKPFPQMFPLELDVVSRADGWKEVQVGSFYIFEKDNRVVLALLSFYGHLIIEGLEFRPVPQTPLERRLIGAPTRSPKKKFFSSNFFRL